MIEDESLDEDSNEPDLKTDFEEIVPQPEGIIHEVYERPEKEYLQELLQLPTQVTSKNLVHIYLPKQVDLGKNTHNNTEEVLRDTHLPVTGRIFKHSILQGCLSAFST